MFKRLAPGSFRGGASKCPKFFKCRSARPTPKKNGVKRLSFNQVPGECRYWSEGLEECRVTRKRIKRPDLLLTNSRRNLALRVGLKSFGEPWGTV